MKRRRQINSYADVLKKAEITLDYAIPYMYDKGVDLYTRTVVLDMDIDEKAAQTFVSSVSFLESLSVKYPIILELNSAGGCIDSMLQIINKIQSSPCQFVCHVTGVAYSAALLICVACDERYAFDLSMFMNHEVSYSSIFHQKLNEHEDQHRYLKKREDMFAEFLGNNTKKDKNFWLKNSKKDFYFTSKEALKFGVIEAIIKPIKKDIHV